ncbi:MAG: alpha/beta hydrolase-fold protein, partial [Fusobacteriaceae bacterium]
MFLTIILIVAFVLIFVYLMFRPESDGKISGEFVDVLKYDSVEFVNHFDFPANFPTLEEIKDEVIIETLSKRSDYTKEEMIYNQVYSKNCNPTKAKKVLVLLHGLEDTREDWIYKAKLIENYIYLRKKNEIDEMVFILHDSGYAGESWYANFYGEKDFRYEDYFSYELFPSLKEKFPEAKFGICGFSMGGHGALRLGLKNIDFFSVIGTMAGAVSLVRLVLNQRVLKIFQALFIPVIFFKNFDDVHFLRVFGRKGKQILKNDPYTLLKKIRKEILEHKKFYASVGMEDLDPYYMYRQW